MSKGSYAGSSMGLVRVGYSRSFVRTFGKREARKYVCNRCGTRFKAGETGKQTSFAAYRHIQCPELTLPQGHSSKYGDA